MLGLISANLILFLISASLVLLRIVYLMLVKNNYKILKNHSKTLIVIGSGGHTAEMIKQVKTLNPKLYQPRMYVMADSDTSSEKKILELEEDFKKQHRTNYEITKIPRSRSVNQSYFTSIFTTLYSILKSVPVVVSFKPDLILCNGPGTCIPVCLISFLLNACFYLKTKIVFIESICRVKTLSLSGKILVYFADVVIVQWPDLCNNYPKTVYLGRLV